MMDMEQQNKIRMIRRSRGMTQKQLAEAIGTSMPQINRLEWGNRKLTVEWLNKIANALKCHPSELFTEIEQEGKNKDKAVMMAIEMAYRFVSEQHITLSPPQFSALCLALAEDFAEDPTAATEENARRFLKAYYRGLSLR